MWSKNVDPERLSLRAAIDDLVSDSLYWKMAPGDTDVMWFEVRDAIMTKVFDFQYELGRQELYSEQVMENGI